MLTNHIHRTSFGFFPTPLHALPRLTEKLGGPRLFVKRDDQTGLATGGNKTRKLEFLVADALAHKADALITAGAPQSNHARQTAAAAARMGMTCVLVLRGQPPAERQGNLLLDDLLGAQIRWTEKNAVPTTMETIAAELHTQGRTPYLIPYGGSNPIGATGYVAAMEELMGQAREMNLSFDRIGRSAALSPQENQHPDFDQDIDYPRVVVDLIMDVPPEAVFGDEPFESVADD